MHGSAACVCGEAWGKHKRGKSLATRDRIRTWLFVWGRILPTLEAIKPGALLRGLDPAGNAEVVQVARFGADALNLVFRVDGRVGERLVYRGEETCSLRP